MNYILYNPLANNKTGKEMCIKAIEEIKNEYKDLIEVDLIHSDKEKLMKKFTKNDNVILVGGDGTLNRTANYLYGKPMPYKLFLYKAGTGNDFIRDIIHEKQNQGKLIYLNDYLKKLPKVTINGKVYRFINNVAYGLDGQVCEVADQQKARGKKKINYTSIAINLLLVKYKLVNATITVMG
ncbi:MAG: diacylglycerol kinase family protein [Bacilli bacterium]